MRRAEPDRAALTTSTVIQRAILRPFADWGVVVGAAEHAVLPAPAVTALVCGEPPVTSERLELGSIDPARGEVFQERSAPEETVGMKVKRHPQVRIHRRALCERVDVPQRNGYRRSAGEVQALPAPA